MLEFKYHLIDTQGKQKDFIFRIDETELTLIASLPDNLPEWTKLNFHKCPTCTLNESEHLYCPVAAHLFPIFEFFRNSVSYENTTVVLETKDRNYSKHTSLQQGVSAMSGVVMVTSGCPILSKLKPMVRFHLPFASPQETLYRAMSMYLMEQYCKYKQGLKPDWELQGLIDIYEKVHEVNLVFCQRLTSLQSKDANVNALIILDNFANYINFSIDHAKLNRIEELFRDNLK